MLIGLADGRAVVWVAHLNTCLAGGTRSSRVRLGGKCAQVGGCAARTGAGPCRWLLRRGVLTLLEIVLDSGRETLESIAAKYPAK
jgi:hypothetical protein